MPARADVTVELFTQLTIAGLVLGSIYALSGLGLVATYRTAGVLNLGHGAVAMLVAFVVWQLWEWGLPVGVAALIGVLVIAPVLGLVLELAVFRQLRRRNATPVDVLVATVGVFIVLVGLAVAVWGFETRPEPPSLLPQHTVHLPGGARLGVDQLGIVVLTVALTWLVPRLLSQTAFGLQVRAVVDDRDLAALTGVDTDRVAGYGWALGAALAGLTGVLLAPATFGLNPYSLTLLVTETLAVAVLAGLTSLPRAALAGVALGLAASFATRLATVDVAGTPGALVRAALASVPVLALLAALVLPRLVPDVAPQRFRASLPEPVRPDQLVGRAAVTVGLVVALVLAPTVAGGEDLRRLHEVVAVAVVLLSIVLVTGVGGVVSLAQPAFAGLGALLVGRLLAGTLGLPPLPLLAALGLAVLATAALGGLVGGLLRRHTVLLPALLTFAVALLLERLVFGNYALSAGLVDVTRDGTWAQAPQRFHAVVVGGLAVAIAALVVARRGRTGRTLRALRDSLPAAAAVGIRPGVTTAAVLAAGAGLAALGGALLALATAGFSAQSFGTVQGLTWFAAVVVAGVSTVSGALLAAAGLVGLAAVVGTGPVTMLVGLGALGIASLRGGLVPALRRRARPRPPRPPQRQLVPTPFARRLLAAQRGSRG